MNSSQASYARGVLRNHPARHFPGGASYDMRHPTPGTATAGLARGPGGVARMTRATSRAIPRRVQHAQHPALGEPLGWQATIE